MGTSGPIAVILVYLFVRIIHLVHCAIGEKSLLVYYSRDWVFLLELDWYLRR
jgi:hypothetical protein